MSGSHGVARSRNQARADYADEVTGRQFVDRSNPVEIQVVRFAALTSTHVAQSMTGGAASLAARGGTPMREAVGSRTPETATGLELVHVGRDVAVPAPIVGTLETRAHDRGLPPARLVGEVSPLRHASWREVVAAEARARPAAAASTAGTGQLVQWPLGVHEIGSDISLATILEREDVGALRAPIVVLDFLTRFKQRPKLVLTKSADRERAFAGEVVTFTVTFFNDSAVEASNVIIADVLDEQCDYKPDTAQCSRPFTFKFEQTTERRPVLVWRLTDPVGPHEAGTITYQLVVRKAWVR